MPRHRLVPILAVGTAVAALGAVGAPSAPAHADPDSPHQVTSRITGPARSAGVTRQGGAWMGWSSPTDAPGGGGPPAARAQAASTVPGIDVSRYQGSVSWASYYAQGKRFAYVKATEGSSYTSPTFSAQYTGSAEAGMVRGAYHFAIPSGAGGATQARYFVSHGGGWSADGTTLPGVLDIEYNPYSGGTCYGLSQAAMRSWISSFTTTYRSLTGRDAVIYSTTDWWRTCTGNTSAFAATNPLWIARYSSSVGALPAGWGYHTFWQYSSDPIDQDRFNGSLTRLRALATG